MTACIVCEFSHTRDDDEHSTGLLVILAGSGGVENATSVSGCRLLWLCIEPGRCEVVQEVGPSLDRGKGCVGELPVDKRGRVFTGTVDVVTVTGAWDVVNVRVPWRGADVV